MLLETIELLKQIKYHQLLTLQQWIEELQIQDVEKFNTEINLLKQKGFIKTNQQGYLVHKAGDFYEGVLSVSSRDYGFVDTQDNGGIYVHLDHFNGAMHGDDVLVHVYTALDGRSEGEILQIIKRNKQHLVGTLYENLKGLIFKAYDAKISDPIPYSNPHHLELKNGQRVLGYITNYNPLEIELTDILGLETEPGVDVLTILYQYEIRPGFNADELQQARSFEKEIRIDQYPHRRNLIQETIFTIDGADTKDIDDAISIDKTESGYRLGVHIADVSHYVSENSPIDVGARDRGTSVYVVDRVVPMLPIELSNGLCSLNPSANRLAMSVYIDLDEYGTIVDAEFFESIIQSKQSLNYREVNRFLENPKDMVYIQENIKEKLLLMDELSNLLRIQREALGAIEFETSESEFVVDSKGNVLDVKARERGRAEMIIEDFMICANQSVASLFNNAQLPTLYRVHEKPPHRKMQSLSMTLRVLGYRMKGSLDNIYPADIQRILYRFRNDPAFHVVSKLVLRSMAKAKYFPQNLGHFGLGLKNYLHFTSPIRRYPDLIVHRNLKKYFIHGEFDPSIVSHDEKLMIELGELTSFKERNAEEAERDVEKMKKTQYISQFVGKKFQGIVSGITKFGMFVELPNTVEGLVHISSMNGYYHFDETKMQLIGKTNNQTFSLGQPVRVKIVSVDLIENETNFELIENRNKEEKFKNKAKKKKRVKNN